jgi:purine catabolism regulator
MVVEIGHKELHGLVYPVEVSSTQLGSIIVWEHTESRVDARALMAIQHGATVVALKMMETRSIGQVEQQFRNEILEGLLSEQAASQATALQLSESLGHRLDPPFALLLVGSDVPSHRLLASRERRQQSNVDTSLHLAQRYIRGYRDGLSFWRRGPHLIVFYPLEARNLRNVRDSIASMLREVCQRIEAENAPYTVSSGISRPVEAIGAFRQAYEEARQSLEIGRALASDKSSAVTHFDDLGLLRFAQVSETSVGVRSYCIDMLGPLLEHDRSSTARLLDTLRVFLECNQNHAEAARVLGIHYNSLRYRLKRIRQLIGDIFEEPQKRLAIEVALHLYPLLDRDPLPEASSPASQ